MFINKKLQMPGTLNCVAIGFNSKDNNSKDNNSKDKKGQILKNI